MVPTFQMQPGRVLRLVYNQVYKSPKTVTVAARWTASARHRVNALYKILPLARVPRPAGMTSPRPHPRRHPRPGISMRTPVPLPGTVSGRTELPGRTPPAARAGSWASQSSLKPSGMTRTRKFKLPMFGRGRAEPAP